MNPNHLSENAQKKQHLYLILTGVAILAVILDFFMGSLMLQKTRSDQKSSLALELGTTRARLEEQVNKNFFLIYGMAAFISSRSGISPKEFDSLARILLDKSNSLKNIAAAPDFVIQHVYPLEGNEKILGLDYRTHPEQWRQALAAKETGRMTLAGPLALVQGGQGLVARVPVFHDDTGAFWGLVSAMIDFNALLNQSGIQSTETGMDLAIRGQNSKGEKGDIIWGNSELFTPGGNAVIMPVSLPSGSWQMAAQPREGWANHFRDSWIIHLPVFLFTLLVMFSIVQQQKSRKNLIESENRLMAMSHASHDALVMIDSSDTVIFWNPSAVAMFGYTEEEMINKKLHDLVTLPQDMEKAKTGLKQFGKTGKGPVMNSIIEMTAIRKSGEVFPVERSVSSFLFNNRWCAVGSLRDITQRKTDENRLMELATTDALTGISNRHHFMALSEMEIKKAIRYQRKLCLLMFDIDHFKRVNDTYGHDAGDKVLRSVAESVRSVLREIDILGRIGGEEFAVTAPETGLNAALQMAERIRKTIMAAAVTTGSHTIQVTVSIGVAQMNATHNTIPAILKKADELLYEAKRDGRNRIAGMT